VEKRDLKICSRRNVEKQIVAVPKNEDKPKHKVNKKELYKPTPQPNNEEQIFSKKTQYQTCASA